MRASDAFEKSLEARPDWPEATFNLALAYEQAGKNARAAAAYRSFLAGRGADDPARREEAERRLACLKP